MDWRPPEGQNLRAAQLNRNWHRVALFLVVYNRSCGVALLDDAAAGRRFLHACTPPDGAPNFAAAEDTAFGNTRADNSTRIRDRHHRIAAAQHRWVAPTGFLFAGAGIGRAGIKAGVSRCLAALASGRGVRFTVVYG